MQKGKSIFGNSLLLKSQDFRQSVRLCISLTKINHPQEAGFSCWIDERQIVVNKPVLGKDYEISDHDQTENAYPIGEGYHEGEGSQTVIHAHTHPLSPSGNCDREVELMSPSVPDITALITQVERNKKIAEIFSREAWVNPVGMIVSPGSKNWSLFQFKAEALSQYKDPYDAVEWYQKPLRLMYEKYYPQNNNRALASTGTIKEACTSPGLLGHLHTHLCGLPPFLMVSTKRMQEFFNFAGISWMIVDPENLPESCITPHLIMNPLKNEDDEDFDLGEDDEDSDEGEESYADVPADFD